MTLNKELFLQDPTKTTIPNDGVAKVVRPETTAQWAVLEWELRSFVCEGEFERGLERILASFLTNLGQTQQPAVWISGFYGSGKSHLCRVLEYLWRDVKLPRGETGRSLVDLPTDIGAHFVELSNAGKRLGGLWSAAGTLAAGKSREMRLAFLSVLFDSAGLPQQYPLARFTLWARENGYLNPIQRALEAAGKRYDHEVKSLYVSPVIAQALLEAEPSLAASVAEVHSLLQAQFPPVTQDITDDEMFDAVEDMLRLMSDTPGRYPLTLIVLDELQQYLNDDPDKALLVQNIAEGLSSRFDNCILFVATGQSAMGATPTLQKLTDRFTLEVALSDKDVETVVRQVILRKRPDRKDELAAVLDSVSGEIDRHLGGTKIAAVAADRQDLVPDYPLLPARRRFWELALRALDRAGKAGVLRTQLRTVHEATREVAEKPLGQVVGADFLYDQQAASLQQSGALLKEISEKILALKDEGDDGEVKSRICALVFLINNIPEQVMGTGQTGLRATAPYLCDLLVEDLKNDGARLRRRIPELLDELVDSGHLVRVDDEYRLQTEEGAEWEKEYTRRRLLILDDASKLATLRNQELYRAVEAALGGLRLLHGKSRTPRKPRLHLGADEPVADESEVPLWIRDEWMVSEAEVKNAAAQAGDESPVVFVLLPKQDANAIKEALASHAAAQETVDSEPTPQTEGGKVARRAMRARIELEEERVGRLIEEVLQDAQVHQGGGSLVAAADFRSTVQLAAERSLARLFPKFDVADHSSWGKVVTLARAGAPDALQAVGYSGEVTAHPVSKEVLATISAGGTKGSALDKRFSDPPYGWPQDAIRGAVMALLATRHIRAAQDGTPLGGPKQLEPRQIGSTTFYKEDDPPTTTQRLAVRGLLAEAGIAYENGQEQAQIPALLQRLLDLAAQTGGPPPLPPPPDTSHLTALTELGGNQQFRAIADADDRLKGDLSHWRAAAARREARQEEWILLERLLHHARDLDEAAPVGAQRDAIRDGRQLLDQPDPVQPLLGAIAAPLRKHVEAASDALHAAYDKSLAELKGVDAWQRLSAEDRADILDRAGLRPPDVVDVASQEKLLAVLNDAPLTSWRDKIEVVRAHARRALEEAVKRLEPAAVRIALTTATLKTGPEVDEYLGDLRKTILGHVDQGQPVIIG